MTIREFYDNILVELNKIEAPSLLLEDFNYFANKAVQQYINKVYNRYDVNQQSTDDLSALKMSTTLPVIVDAGFSSPSETQTYCCQLPQTYWHLLNCIVEFTRQRSSNKCGSETKKQSMARRLTSDMYPSIINNAYLKPSHKCPYYFINNTQKDFVDDFALRLNKLLDPSSQNDPNFYDNLRMEIRCGDDSIWYPSSVWIDYVKMPDKIELTWDELNDVNDTTKKLEFPEYVCYEIINEFVKLALENFGDPRLETNYTVNQTIAGVSNNN